jgi:Protein of unknown function (DUF2815)
MPKGKKEKRASQQTVVTGIGAFMNVFSAKPFSEGDDPKYSVAILIPKKDPQVKQLAKIIQDLAIEAFGASASKQLASKDLWNPLQDGDKKKDQYQGYGGHYYLNASNLRRPGVVDFDLQPITDPDECYAGCTIQVSVNFFTYHTGSPGVGVGLNNVRVIKKGDHLDGRVAAGDEQWPEAKREEGGEEAKAEEEAEDLF